jgi:hypothetical protein
LTQIWEQLKKEYYILVDLLTRFSEE